MYYRKCKNYCLAFVVLQVPFKFFFLCFVFHAFLLCFEHSNFSKTFKFFKNIRNSNVRITTSFRIFLKIFELLRGIQRRDRTKGSAYWDVRVFEIFFASKGLVNSRDLEKSSTYRVVRVFECSSYRESTIHVFFFIRTKFIRTIRLKFGQKLRTS